MLNTIKTIELHPNLPAELDNVVVLPPDLAVNDNALYQSQFRSDFRV